MSENVGYDMCMRLHITLPEDTVRAIDDVAGQRGRSAFIREAVTKEAERERKMKLFWSAVGSIPEFAPGVSAEAISAERKRDGQARGRKLREHRDAPRHDDPD